MAHEGTRDCEFLIYLLIYTNKLAYLQAWACKFIKRESLAQVFSSEF